MKYLYIPTSTLNFNSILSTESISPVAICASRDFGNNRFEKVDPNPFDNLLLLYDRYPNFNIEDQERDNFPMVLRLSAKRVSREALKTAYELEGINVYICTQTIYLDPSSAVFYFPTSNAKKIAIAKAEPSLATKLVSLYEPFFQVQDFRLESFDWSKSKIEGIKDNPNTAIDECCKSDIRINRLKGFVYGYILGAYRSTDTKMVQLASEIGEIRNKASAVTRDHSSSFSEKEREALDEHLKCAERLLEETGIGRLRFNPQNMDGINIDNSFIAEVRDSNEKDKRFTNSLVSLANEFCFKGEFSGHLDEVREQVAFDGAQAIKAHIGEDRWQDSPSKSYLTDLINNIVNGEPFDFRNSKSLALLSFAAFALKGDTLEKLEGFLISNGIGDFRIAFALWGAMFGYSKIPKTVFNLPFEHGDQAYAKEMHRYVHSVVHGIRLKDLEWPSPLDQPLAVAPAESRTSEPGVELLDQLFEHMPASKHWEGNLRELWGASDGQKEKFIKRLNKTTINDLGGNIKGVFKTAIIEFIQNPNSPYPGELFPATPQQTEVFFCNDGHAWDVICDVVSADKRDIFEKNLRWFQKEWQNPTSKYYGRDSQSSVASKPLDQRTNDEAILYFCRTLINEKHPVLDKRTAEAVKRLLRDKYR
ncbi:hypothetical protein ACFL3I_08260 [Pseudomonadota bacterium]